MKPLAGLCALVAALMVFPVAPASADGPVATLDSLPVFREVDANSYERKAFGPAWKDVDRNGCDQRNDVLARDLKKVTKRGRCVVMSGLLTDPYTGVAVSFTKRRASAVQIDHVVALAEAWRSGASGWTPERRLQFANDRVNLLATKASVNMSKSDDDAADFTPTSTARRCLYAKRVVAVKAKWGLAVDTREKAALRRYLAGC